MSLLQRYPTLFSVTEIIGNSANDYSAAPRHKQQFFEILDKGSNNTPQPNYYYPFRVSDPYESRLKYQPFEAVGYVPNIFNDLFGNAMSIRNKNKRTPNINPITSLEQMQNMSINTLKNSLAGRYSSTLFT